MTAYYNEWNPRAAQWLRDLISDGIIAPGIVDERSIVDVKPEDLDGFYQCHFFAGVGGWPYAVRLAGIPDDLPLWTASLPCQPFSAAGKQKGVKDDRHLFPVFEELFKAKKPKIIFGEQVSSSEVVGSELEAAFISAVQRGDYAAANKFANKLVKSKSLGESARWLDGVYSSLEASGYSPGSIVLGAHSAGAPQLRQRVYWSAALERHIDSQRTNTVMLYVAALAEDVLTDLISRAVREMDEDASEWFIDLHSRTLKLYRIMKEEILIMQKEIEDKQDIHRISENELFKEMILFGSHPLNKKALNFSDKVRKKLLEQGKTIHINAPFAYMVSGIYDYLEMKGMLEENK